MKIDNFELTLEKSSTTKRDCYLAGEEIKVNDEKND